VAAPSWPSKAMATRGWKRFAQAGATHPGRGSCGLVWLYEALAHRMMAVLTPCSVLSRFEFLRPRPSFSRAALLMASAL
jgi:hypothetical protein